MIDETDHEVWIYAIYDHPDDFPNEWVCRCWKVKGGEAFTAPATFYRTPHSLDELRFHLEARGLVRLPHDPRDDPKILECWM